MKMMLRRVLLAVSCVCLIAVALGLVSEIKQFWKRDDKDHHIAISVVEEGTQGETGETGGERQETKGSQGQSRQEEETGSTEADTADEAMESSEEVSETEEQEQPVKRAGKRPEWKYQIPPATPLPPVSEQETLPCVWLISDLHYMSASMTDYGKAFEEFVSRCDGKVVRYLPEILDTVLWEAANEKPDALILTGDITMDGERVNHEELAKKLAGLQEQGIQVLVIPGNHDINNPNSRKYFGETSEEADRVSPEEFGDIYEAFGPDQAVSRDEASFSYVYPLRENIWLMLLDTAQYDPVNLVDGAVRPETYRWMEENLEAAAEQGIQVIVLGHHNLLQESRMFTAMCVMENSSDVVELLERYQLPLYISGHLHLQRVKKHKTEPGAEGYGIHEIVSDAFSIPPCQYGVMSWLEDGTVDYRTRQAQVSAWAESTGSADENLLSFSDYQREYIHQLIKEQVKRDTADVPEDAADSMARLYADVYADYCAGLEIHRWEVEGSKGFKNWKLYLSGSKELDEIGAMVKDSFEDSNRFVFSAEGY